MAARTPKEVDDLFGQYLNSGNLDGLVSLYESDAVLVQQDRSEARGLEAIRQGLAGFVAMKPKIVMNVVAAVTAGNDVAVLYNDWNLEAPGPDGKPAQMSGKAIEIVRRQSDGSWRFILDDPFARG